jgi:phage gp45-like
MTAQSGTLTWNAHGQEREHAQDASYVDGWKQRSALRPGKGAIVAAHSSKASDSVILAFATGTGRLHCTWPHVLT